MDEIKQIVILLEFNDGSVKQVLTSKHLKRFYLKFLEGEDGTLKVSKAIKPLVFEEIKPFKK